MGSVYGNRGTGGPKTRCSDNIRDRAGIRSIVAIYRLAQDRATAVIVCLTFNDDEAK